MLQCWYKFSNILVHRSIRMIHAKNYETVSKFVKVMPRILWPLFSRTRCIRVCTCSWWRFEWVIYTTNEIPPLSWCTIDTQVADKKEWKSIYSSAYNTFGSESERWLVRAPRARDGNARVRHDEVLSWTHLRRWWNVHEQRLQPTVVQRNSSYSTSYYSGIAGTKHAALWPRGSWPP